VLFSSLGCPSQTCVKYQDVARIDVNGDIDSVAMIANGSFIGCRNYWYDFKVIGSKTHNVNFPINVRILLFSQGTLWKEFFVEMDKNTELKIFTGHGCSYPSSYEYTFSHQLELAKAQNRFIDLSFTDDYCWLLQKMDNSSSSEDLRCMELDVDGERQLCRGI